MFVALCAVSVLLAGCGSGGQTIQYDEQQALTYAYLATAAMCSSKDEYLPGLLKWKCGPACDEVSPGMTHIFNVSRPGDAYVYAGKLNGECTVVFRGTSDLVGWLKDLQSIRLTKFPGCSLKNGTECKVGDGFLANYMALRTGLMHGLASLGCSQLAIAGHSLGGAEATIAMFDLAQANYTILRSYTFGQPRVGDAAFKVVFEEMFKTVPTYRVTHADDPAPQLPPRVAGFEHVGTEVYYENTTNEGYRVCDGSGEDPTCAASRRKDFIKAVGTCVKNRPQCAHLAYLTPLKKVLMQNTCAEFHESLLV